MPVVTSLSTNRTEPRLVPVCVEMPPPRHELRADRCLVGRPLAVARRRRQVVLLRVLSHHTVGRKLWSQTRHALTHFGDPGPGDALRVSRIERGNDVALEQRIERLG